MNHSFVQRSISIFLAVLLFIPLFVESSILAAAEESEFFDFYYPVLEAFYNLDVDELDWENMLPGSNGIVEMLRYEGRENAMQHIGYAIRDLSGDGIPELAFGYIAEPENGTGEAGEIYAVFNCTGDEPACVLEGWVRNCFMPLDDGSFYNYGFNGAMYAIMANYTLSEDGSELICNDYFFTYEKEDFEHIGIFYNTTGDWDKMKSYELQIGMDEFDAFAQGYRDKAVTIPMISLSALQQKDPLPVSAKWANKSDLPETFEEFTADQTNASVKIIFSAEDCVRNFKLLSLTFRDASEDGTLLFDTQDLVTYESLNSSTPLVIEMTFFGDIPNYGISYIGENDTPYRFALAENGKDGSLILLPF